MTSKKEQRRHFLLVGHSGIYNRGCEAILEATFALLRERFVNPTFSVVSFDWANDHLSEDRWEGVRFRNITPERWRCPHWYLRVARRFFRLPAGDWRSAHRHLRAEYRRADAVLSVGGDNYTTDYSAFPGYYLDVLKYAREQGTKDVVWGATVGRFDDPVVREKVVEVLKDTALITARESLTVEYLASLGITQNVRAVADPAFLLEPLASPAVQAYPIGKTNTNWLGLSVSSMLWRYVADGLPAFADERSGRLSRPCALFHGVRANGQGQKRDRSDALVDFIKSAIEKLGMSVALIPHVIDTRATAPINRNDHHFLSQIRAEIGKPDRLVLADASLRAREMKYLISRCRFFIGSRTHSTIAALSSGVPTISLSYSMKSRGINRDVLGHEDFVLPVNDLSLENLQKMLQKLTDREAEVRATLEKRMPVIKENARKNADYLAQVLERHSL